MKKKLRNDSAGRAFDVTKASPKGLSILRLTVAVTCIALVSLMVWTGTGPTPHRRAQLHHHVPEAPVRAVVARNASFDLSVTCPVSHHRRFHLYASRWEQALLESQLAKDPPPVLQPVAGAAITDALQVYTAFLTETTVRGVHVVGLVRNDAGLRNASQRLIPPLECIIQADRRTWETHVNVTEVNEYDPYTVFQTIYLICPAMISLEDLHKPLKVAFKVSANDSHKMHWLRVHVPPSPRVNAKCCSVCVRPVYGDKPSLWEIIEFVTHYRMIGASHFYFYYMDTRQPLNLLISRLQSMGVDITLIPLNKPASTSAQATKEWVARSHQLVALSDYIFRSRMKTEYFMHVDLDEFMAPPRGANLTDVIDRVEKEHGAEAVGSIIVRSKLFCYEYGLDHAYMRRRESLPLRSRVLLRSPGTAHDAYIDKMIARGSAVCAAYVHWVSQYCDGRFVTIDVPEDVIYFSHYRECCWPYARMFTQQFEHPEELFMDRSMEVFYERFYSVLPFAIPDMQTATESFE